MRDPTMKVKVDTDRDGVDSHDGAAVAIERGKVDQEPPPSINSALWSLPVLSFAREPLVN